MQSDAPSMAPVKSVNTSAGDSGIGLCGRSRRVLSIEESVFGILREVTLVKASPEVAHHFMMLAVTATSALFVWYIFHNVYTDLSRTETAIGYVDPMTQMGITLGYFTMIGGSAILGIIALWSAIQIVRCYWRASKT